MNTSNIVSIKLSVSNRTNKLSSHNSFSKTYYCLLPLNLISEFKIKDMVKVSKTNNGFRILRANLDDSKTIKITSKGRINIPSNSEKEIEGNYEMNIIDTDTIELIKL